MDDVLCFHTMGPMGGRARFCVVCRVAVPAGVADGQARAAAAHWLAGSAGRLAGVTGVRWPG